MQEALRRGDLEEVQRIAHSLKSSSGIFGAHQMVKLCRDLETASVEGGTVGQDPIPLIYAAFERVRAVLNWYRRKE
jgi:HPt (histidine-containing phosphotransfer) domain-containing protein